MTSRGQTALAGFRARILLGGILLGWISLGSCAPTRLGDDEIDIGAGMMTTPGERKCEADADCGAGRRCIDSTCIMDNGSCRTDDGRVGGTPRACPPVT